MHFYSLASIIICWFSHGFVIRIGRFPVQTHLGGWLGLGTEPRYEINVGLLRLCPFENGAWPVDHGTAK